MKTGIKCIVIVVLSAMLSCSDSSTPQSYGPEARVSMQLFYDQLSPYGRWVNYLPYGYVWFPEVGLNFSPYATSGNWIYTSYGWTWHSYYSWGWAPFHYGRWFFDSFYGWMWVPDTVWGPAWVIWSMGGGYCGWAPLAPQISVNAALSGQYIVPRDHWVFVKESDLSQRNIARFRLSKSKNESLLDKALLVRQMREQNNVTFMPGPDRNIMQKKLNRPITPVAIREREKPGNGRFRKNELKIFKPNVKENTGARKSTPTRVFELENIKSRHNQYEQPGRGNDRTIENPSLLRSRNDPFNRRNMHPGNSGKRGKKNN